ncbi:MAG: hypothetical protein JWR37_3458 [Mycobacterium sp.]|jgi:hypothetical protein|nr:hypothetical protein [Mycobacterium sp.]
MGGRVSALRQFVVATHLGYARTGAAVAQFRGHVNRYCAYAEPRLPRWRWSSPVSYAALPRG